jgi:hypothetical protein
MPDIFYFGHREPPKKVSASPFKNFVVQCGKCKSERIRAKSDQDFDSGEVAVFLICECGEREKVPVS